MIICWYRFSFITVCFCNLVEWANQGGADVALCSLPLRIKLALPYIISVDALPSLSSSKMINIVNKITNVHVINGYGDNAVETAAVGWPCQSKVTLHLLVMTCNHDAAVWLIRRVTGIWPCEFSSQYLDVPPMQTTPQTGPMMIMNTIAPRHNIAWVVVNGVQWCVMAYWAGQLDWGLEEWKIGEFIAIVDCDKNKRTSFLRKDWTLLGGFISFIRLLARLYISSYVKSHMIDNRWWDTKNEVRLRRQVFLMQWGQVLGLNLTNDIS